MRPFFVELLAWAVAVGTAGGRAPCAALAFDHRGSTHSLLPTRSRLDSVPPGLQGVRTLQGKTNAMPLRGGEASASEQQQQREDELLASLLRLETRSKSDAEEASLSDPMQDVGALDGLSPRMQALLKRYQEAAALVAVAEAAEQEAAARLREEEGRQRQEEDGSCQPHAQETAARAAQTPTPAAACAPAESPAPAANDVDSGELDVAAPVLSDTAVGSPHLAGKETATETRVGDGVESAVGRMGRTAGVQATAATLAASLCEETAKTSRPVAAATGSVSACVAAVTECLMAYASCLLSFLPGSLCLGWTGLG